MPGLDAGIHSGTVGRRPRHGMDCRVKPGNDGNSKGECLPFTHPGIESRPESKTSILAPPISVDDLNADFAETEEYAGERRCDLLVGNARAVRLDVKNGEGVRISDARILPAGSRWRLEIDLNLGAGSFGGRSIVALFDALPVLDV